MKRIIILMIFFSLLFFGCNKNVEVLEQEDKDDSIICPDIETYLIKIHGGGASGSFSHQYFLPNGNIFFTSCGGGPKCYDENLSGVKSKVAEMEVEDFSEFLEDVDNFDWEKYRLEMNQIAINTHTPIGMSLYAPGIEKIYIPIVGFEKNYPEFIQNLFNKYGEKAINCVMH